MSTAASASTGNPELPLQSTTIPLEHREDFVGRMYRGSNPRTDQPAASTESIPEDRNESFIKQVFTRASEELQKANKRFSNLTHEDMVKIGKGVKLGLLTGILGLAAAGSTPLVIGIGVTATGGIGALGVYEIGRELINKGQVKMIQHQHWLGEGYRRRDYNRLKQLHSQYKSLGKEGRANLSIEQKNEYINLRRKVELGKAIEKERQAKIRYLRAERKKRGTPFLRILAGV